MEQEILFKAKNETLSLIKVEAEKHLLSIQNTEDVITNKSNNLIQILLPILIVLFGVLVNSISSGKFDWKFQLSLLISILLSFVVYTLYENILPVKSVIQGSEPKQLIQSDMIFGEQLKDDRNILVNRIFSLQKAINYSANSHSIRYKRFKKGNKFLFLGLLIIFILFALFQVFVLFQDKC